MRSNRLCSVLVGFTAVAALAADTSAMYHPTLGRWLQRDPIGYADGMSRYEYVGGRPLAHVDPHGLAYVTVTPLPGWYEEPGLRAPGQVRWGSTVDATCQCTRPETRQWQMVDVRADIQAAITMNPQRFQGQVDTDRQPLTEGGVLGHEQRHLSKITAALDNVKGAVMALLEAAEFILFEIKPRCEAYLAQTLRPKVQSEVNKAAESATGHAGDTPGKTEATGYPVDKRQYAPEPGSDTSRKGERVPWQKDPGWRGNP
ncbi:MAG: hypothetical protein IMZ65_02745, partial [Planctomycetes bacterium]|nr:hypothetical protein [Planctomycetota bacterium]